MINAHNTINGFIKLSRTKAAKQTGILYGSQILVMALGLIIAPIVTRELGPEKYGVLTFILAVLLFISVFFAFGFFSAGARLLAVSKDKKKDQELIGALTLITVGISLSFFLILFIFSFFIDSIFPTSAGNILRSISILAAIIPFQYMLQQICQGANEIKKMAVANIIPKIWYLAGLLIVICFLKLDVSIALVLNLTGIIVAVILIVHSLKPKFNNLKENFKTIWKETKEYGKHVYFGRIASMGTYNSDKMLISYFVNTRSVGFYNLAMIITSPMALLSRALSTSLFKDFAEKEKISGKVILFNFVWLLCCVVGLVVLGKYIIVVLFSNKYLSVVPLILPLALAGFFQGMYQPYNMFLGAKGKGKELRTVAFINMLSNLFGNFGLIPIFGAIGAGWASAIACSLAYYLYRYYYNNLCKKS